MTEMNKEKFKKIIKDKKVSIAVAVGFAAIVCLALSSFLPERSQSVHTSLTAEEYAAHTEAKLEKLVNSITGGKSCVMVTLENGVEYIYASETATDTQKNEDISGVDKTKIQQNEESEQKYIVVKSSNGDERALVVTEIMPTVKGIVVVCDCGGSRATVEAVKSAVVTAMDISERKVCVVDRP